MTTLIKGLNLKTRHIDLVEGSEGPPQDPYGFSEISVTSTYTNDAGEKFVSFLEIHNGLVNWVDINGTRFEFDCENSARVDEELVALTGMTLDQWSSILVEAYNHKISICPHCYSSKHLEYVEGYPGETLVVCDRCRKIAHVHQNFSVVI